MSLNDPFTASMDDWIARERMRFGFAQAVRDPLAQMKVVPVADPPPRIVENSWVPDGEKAYVLAATRYVPRTVVLPMFNRYGERTGIAALTRSTPGWTRHMLGVREAARDRRRRR